jgi:hypothetical protein
MPVRTFVCVVILVMAAQVCFAQSGDVYQLNYYSNRNNSASADQFVRVVNPGVQGTPLTSGHGTICADFYVFDATQEMVECCSCRITANGLAELSVISDLTQNPLTGFPAPNSGVVKIVSDNRQNCNETAPVPTPLLLAWATHIQQPIMGTFVTTEDQFQKSPLMDGELAFLGQACAFVQYLGSGKGVCKCGKTS